MIIFEFADDTDSFGRVVYWLGTISCSAEDKEHESEICEQLDAQTAGYDQ